MSEYRVCVRCVMDTTDPLITFDENGVCNHCKNAELALKSGIYGLCPADKKKALDELVSSIKESGKSLKYDCVIGVSGGVDSTYAAYRVKQAGLRPLAIHLDNGWNSELAVKNIESICKKLDIDLFTYVIDWEEFKDLQMAFLKASTPDSEVPSDHAIGSILYEMAKKEGVKYILAGTNLSSESILPISWSCGVDDWKYIKSVHEKFGKKPLKTFPHRSFFRDYYYRKVAGIKWISLLNYFEYDKEKAKEVIEREIGWRNYGGKHCESNYTKFFQSYILPEKFGFDKRKAHFSSLIMAGQMTREEALSKLREPLYPDKTVLEEEITYVINKFGITRDDFSKIMSAKPKTFFDYPSYRKSKFYNGLIKAYLKVKKVFFK